MSRTVIPEGYRPKLDLYRTQDAIALIKRTFEDSLSMALNLKRVSAPLFVEASTGLNDDLNGVERPVSFDIKETGTGCTGCAFAGKGNAWRCTVTVLNREKGFIRI